MIDRGDTVKEKPIRELRWESKESGKLIPETSTVFAGKGAAGADGLGMSVPAETTKVKESTFGK